MSWAQIFFDDINTTFTVASSVVYEPMPGSTLFTANTGNINVFKPERANGTSARFIVGNQGKGISKVYWGASFTGNQGNNTYHIALFRNGTKLEPTSKERKLGTAGDIGDASGRGYIVLHNNDYVDVRVNAGGTTGVQVTFNHCNFGLDFISTSTDIGVVL